jgi:hypothetical protein
VFWDHINKCSLLRENIQILQMKNGNNDEKESKELRVYNVINEKWFYL